MKNQRNPKFKFVKFHCTITFPYHKKYKVNGHDICHEVAHYYCHERFGRTRHDKKLLNAIKMMVAYCEKRGWWGWRYVGSLNGNKVIVERT